MADRGVYATAKLAHHPVAMAALRRAEAQPPIMVQWFVTHVCSHACEFCSFGSGPESIRAKVVNPPKARWRNQRLYDTRAVTPYDKMVETIDCLQAMGVKCVEVTGGGEPTTYPHFDEMVERIAEAGMEVALVSHGALIDAARAQLLGRLPFTWARISIDSGTVEDYVATRHVSPTQWDRAWAAVGALARERDAPYAHPEAAVGVGFVIDRVNWRHVYEGCRLAKEAGADNIRISASFTPDGMNRFEEDCFREVPIQLHEAKQALEDETFTIHDLSKERWQNITDAAQTYPFCAFKEIGCVLSADLQVWACCSLAFNPLGLMFSIQDQTFQEGWFGDGAAWRARHDPRKQCPVTCLYQRRNLDALRMMGDPSVTAKMAEQPPPPHVNYI